MLEALTSDVRVAREARQKRALQRSDHTGDVLILGCGGRGSRAASVRASDGCNAGSEQREVATSRVLISHSAPVGSCRFPSSTSFADRQPGILCILVEPCGG